MQVFISLCTFGFILAVLFEVQFEKILLIAIAVFVWAILVL